MENLIFGYGGALITMTLVTIFTLYVLKHDVSEQ